MLPLTGGSFCYPVLCYNQRMSAARTARPANLAGVVTSADPTRPDGVRVAGDVPPAGSAVLRRKVMLVHRRLLKVYGVPEPPARRGDALGELIACILSQHTSDLNSGRAYEALRARFPTWELVRDAPARAVVAAIRSSGLANQKGPRIQAVLRAISRDTACTLGRLRRGHGRRTAPPGRGAGGSAAGGKPAASQKSSALDINFLADWPVPEAKAWLQSLHGVGPKTAAITLLFGLGRPAFPVDTHVHRVAGRLGLIGGNMSADRAHDSLEAIVPPRLFFPFHMNLIRHGRKVCQARQPKCRLCPLTDVCVYYATHPVS
jgi:endonuclease III